jgi:hypothetical protein
MPKSRSQLLSDERLCALGIYGLLDGGGLSNPGGNVDVLARRNATRWLYIQRRLSKLQTLQSDER